MHDSGCNSGVQEPCQPGPHRFRPPQASASRDMRSYSHFPSPRSAGRSPHLPFLMRGFVEGGVEGRKKGRCVVCFMCISFLRTPQKRSERKVMESRHKGGKVLGWVLNSMTPTSHRLCGAVTPPVGSPKLESRTKLFCCASASLRPGVWFCGLGPKPDMSRGL